MIVEEIKKKRKQLGMDMSIEMHTLIKTIASSRGITINKWIMRAIEKQLVIEGHIKQA